MKDQKRGTRTESLSLRIDLKTKFVLEFMVRVKGFRITDLIEQAIKEYAEKTTVGYGQDSKSWLYYWHPEEGIRTIKMIFDSDIPTDYGEDEIKDMIQQHEVFFFQGLPGNPSPFVTFIQVLWPKINDYVEHWRDHKATDRWATGALMLQAIQAAGMKGPQWPPVPRGPSPKAKPSQELDDEIPF